MLINDRIRLIIKANGLTSSEFADRIGVKRSNLSHVLSGRNKPGLEFLSKVIESFPNVNASWLITGSQRSGDFEGVSAGLKEEVSTSVDLPRLGSSQHDSDAIQKKKLSNNSEVEKIIMFYSNGTFSVYKPTAQ